MPSESTDYRKQPKQNNPCGGEAAAPPDQQQENLPCPRCDSTNTKFCYYNNYNFSQPRHFCKSCRRYWTRGGTLRDIPVGGGTRKSAKRSRTSPTAAASSSAVVSHLNHPLPATPILLPLRPNSLGPGGPFGDAKPNTGICGTFTSLLNNSSQGPGLWALGGFGLGLGSGLEEVGFGLGRGGWAFPVVGESGGVCGNGDGLAVGNGWQMEAQDGGLGGGDCFPWPDLAISTPGNGFK